MADLNSPLLDLPLELFDAILVHAITVRTLRRAFRLRLVNKFFATEVIRVFHEHRLLDPHPRSLKTAGIFGLDYVTRRILRDDLHLVDWQWHYIRDIALRLTQEDEEALRESQLSEYVKVLCASYLGRNSPSSVTWSTVSEQTAHPKRLVVAPGPVKGARAHVDLMAAAALTKKLSLVEQLAKQANDPPNYARRRGMFGSPLQAAVEGRCHAAVDMLIRLYWSGDGDFPGDVESFQTAVLQDPVDLDMVEKLFPRQWDVSREDWIIRGVERSLFTSSPEVFKRLKSIKQASDFSLFSDSLERALLTNALEHDWMEILECLLDLELSDGMMPHAIESACQMGNFSALSLLLERGATISERAIVGAAQVGKWDMIRFLVGRGADIRIAARHSLFAAIRYERTDIAKEFIALGARVDGEDGPILIRIAKVWELESMVAFLKEMGACDT